MKRCDCCGFNPLYTGHKRVEEKRIGELEKIVADLFPESKGNIQKVDLGKLLEQAGFDLLYKKLPVIFPDNYMAPSYKTKRGWRQGRKGKLNSAMLQLP
jgi:hypothetical protein